MNLISKAFGISAELRGLLYDKSIFKSHKVNSWVISVGNITVGGTGKTPCVDLLTKLLIEKHRVAIVSRGYKSLNHDANRVDFTKPNAATFFGDEPVWLAQSNPKVPVWVSSNRVLGCQKIITEYHPDIIIADDAFQHRSLVRDIDIVVIDATENKKNYEYLPFGRAREGFDSLKRAHAVFLTKTNLVAPDVLRWIKGNIRPFVTANKIFEFESVVESYQRLNSDEICNNFDAQEVILVSGIGKPENFEKSVVKCKVVKHFKFQDHKMYKAHDISQILEYKNHPILTTQKDAVKLKVFSELQNASVWVSQLTFKSKTPMSEIYEMVTP